MSRVFKKANVTNLGGIIHKCWIGLKNGDEVICKEDAYDFIKDKIYKVDHIYNWDGNKIAYVVDESNTCQWVTTKLFNIVLTKEEKRIKIIDKFLYLLKKEEREDKEYF